MIFNKYIDFIHEVKDRVTILETVEFYGFKPNIAHKICCPFHGEKTPSLHIYDKTNTFYCFGCGIGGDSVRFVSELYKLKAFQAAKKINIDMGLNVKEPDSSRSAPAPDTKKQKQEEKAFSVWCELKDLETACINAFDELPENDSGDKMQEDLSMIRKLKGIAENFANYGDESDYNKIVGADTAIAELKRHYTEKEEDYMQKVKETDPKATEQAEPTASQDIFEMLMNADNLTEDKIKSVKLILSSKEKKKPTITGKSEVISENVRNYALSLDKKSDLILYFSELKQFADEYGIDKQLFEDFKRACISDFKYHTTEQEKELTNYPQWVMKTKAGIAIHEPNFIKYFSAERDLKCINGKFYDINGMISQGQLKQQIQADISQYTPSNLAKKTENLYRAIEIDVNTESFKPSMTEIHVLNGILKTDGTFTDEKRFCLNRIQVEYNPNVPKPRTFLKCLNDMLESDDILTLQEFMGYLLIPSTIAQKSLSVIGAGGEGKTTAIGYPLKILFGDSMTDGDISDIANNRFIGADLENKLLFLEDDLTDKKLEDTSMIKKIITNRDRAKVEQKFKDRYSALLYVRILMFGNNCLEALYDTSNGFFRRQLVIQTKPKPEREDKKQLTDELEKEMQGIFNWCFEGLQRLIKNKFHFTVSEKSKEIVRNMKSQAFNFSDFLEDKAQFGKEYATTTAEILFNYKIWCGDNGETPLKDRTITTYLANHEKELKISNTKMMNAGKQVRGYKGIKIVPLEVATIT